MLARTSGLIPIEPRVEAYAASVWLCGYLMLRIVNAELTMRRVRKMER